MKTVAWLGLVGFPLVACVYIALSPGGCVADLANHVLLVFSVVAGLVWGWFFGVLGLSTGSRDEVNDDTENIEWILTRVTC